VAEGKLELAVSRILAGERAGGVGGVLAAVAAHPSQLLKVARLGGRRLRRLVASI